MPSYIGNFAIVLQPGDTGKVYKFEYPIKTEAYSNENVIPFGATISSAVFTASTSDGTDITSDILESPVGSTDDDAVYVTLKYPVINGAGTYDTKIELTLSTTATMEFDLNRVIARDL